MIVDGKLERDLGKIPHSQLVEWAIALDRVVPSEENRKHGEVLRELQRYLWAVIQCDQRK